MSRLSIILVSVLLYKEFTYIQSTLRFETIPARTADLGTLVLFSNCYCVCNCVYLKPSGRCAFLLLTTINQYPIFSWCDVNIVFSSIIVKAKPRCIQGGTTPFTALALHTGNVSYYIKSDICICHRVAWRL